MVGQHIRGIPSRCTSQKGGLHATEDKGAVGNTGGGDPPPQQKKATDGSGKSEAFYMAGQGDA